MTYFTWSRVRLCHIVSYLLCWFFFWASYFGYNLSLGIVSGLHCGYEHLPNLFGIMMLRKEMERLNERILEKIQKKKLSLILK